MALKSKISASKERELETKRKLEISEQQQQVSVQHRQELMKQLAQEQHTRQELWQLFLRQKKEHRDKVEGWKKRLKRAEKVRVNAVERAQRGVRTSKSAAFKVMQKRAYSTATRKLLRLLVANGCARAKAGQVLTLLAAQFGVSVKVASRRTVSRAVLEGYIASKMQIGYEINQTPGMWL